MKVPDHGEGSDWTDRIFCRGCISWIDEEKWEAHEDHYEVEEWE